MNQVKSKDSNSKQGSELLEAVGGLEAAQAIVNGAPDKTADFYVEDINEYCSIEFGSYFSKESNDWEDSDYHTESELREAYESVFSLSDLRTAIAGQDYASKPSSNLYPFCTLCSCWDGGSQCNCEPEIPVRADEAEILLQCAACTTKDHDLTVLRKLQASSLSIYAGRVYRQQTQILIYEVIIGALIIACVGLFLWGLK